MKITRIISKLAIIHRIWEKGSKEFEAMRELGRKAEEYEYIRAVVESRPPETIANMALILLNQTDYLLFKQMKSLENSFVEKGGFHEKMYNARKEHLDGYKKR